MSRVVGTPPRRQATRKVGRHRVRKGIERLIFEGRTRPGEKLVVIQLAKKFGVSQGMVREALLELKECGIVETSDNRGMFVRSVDVRSIYEMVVIREVFDGVVARECCGRMSADDAATLRKMADEIYQLATTGRQKERVALDRQFHLEIAQLTENRILLTWAQQHMVLSKLMGPVGAVRPEESRRGHHAIIDAILAGDRNYAEQLAREHVRATWPTLEGALASSPDAVLWLTEGEQRPGDR